MNLLRRTAVTGMLVAIGACSEATAPTSSTTIGPNLIRLTVSSSSAVVVRGSPVKFAVSLVNEGAASATLHFGDSCQIIPTIRNELGEIVLPSGGTWGCLTVLTQLTLLPGEPVRQEFIWTGSTAFQSEEPLRALPPGKYFFTAEVPAGEATLRATIEVVLK
jgi:Intracellular proteinase inhibitor